MYEGSLTQRPPTPVQGIFLEKASDSFFVLLTVRSTVRCRTELMYTCSDFPAEQMCVLDEGARVTQAIGTNGAICDDGYWPM